MQSLQQTSQLAKYINACIEKKQQDIINITKQEDHWVPLIFNCLDILMTTPPNLKPGEENEMDEEKLFNYLHDFDSKIQDVVEAALKSIQLQGFQNNYKGLSVIPKLNGFQLILALFDCFSHRAQSIENSIRSDIYFNGDNMIEFLFPYIKISNENIQKDEDFQDIDNYNQNQQNIQFQDQSQQQQNNNFQENIQNTQNTQNDQYQNTENDQQQQLAQGEQQNTQESQQQLQKTQDNQYQNTQSDVKTKNNTEEKQFVPNQIVQNNQYDEGYDIESSQQSQITNNIQQNQTNNIQITEISQDPGFEQKIYAIEQIILRMEELSNKKKCQRAKFLKYEFINFRNQITSDLDDFDLNQKQYYLGDESLEFNKNERTQLIWEKLKKKTKLGLQINKREEDAIRKIAFQEFYYDALVQLSEKSLLNDNDVDTMNTCYSILFCLGYKDSINQFYTSSIYLQNYDEASIIADKMGSFHRQAYCLVKLEQQYTKAFQLIRRNLLESNEQSILVTGGYIMSQCSAYDDKKFIESLILFHILIENEQAIQHGKINHDTKQDVIYDLFMMAKIIENGNLADSNKTIVRNLLKYIKCFLPPESLNDQMTLLFVNRKLGTQNTKFSTQQYNKYRGMHFQQAILDILELDLRDIRKYCENELSKMKQYLEDNKESMDPQEIAYQDQLKFKIKWADKILFIDQNEYNIKFFHNAEDKFQHKNQQIANHLRKFKDPNCLWVQNLIKPQMSYEEFCLANSSEMSQKVKNGLQSNQNFRQGYITYTQSIQRQIYQQNQENLEKQQQQQENNDQNADFSQNQIQFDNQDLFDTVFDYFVDPDLETIEFKGFLCQGSINEIPSEWLEQTDQNNGYFKFNQQKFSIIKLQQSKKVQKYIHLIKNPSPYFLNAYGIIKGEPTLIVEPFAKRLFDFLDEVQQQNQEKEDKIYNQKKLEAENELKNSELMYNVQSKLTQESQEKSKQDIIEEQQETLSQGEHEQEQQDPNIIINQNLFENIDPLVLITQLIAIVAAQHMDCISGFMSMYPKQILYLTDRGELKTNNILALLLRQKKQTRYCSAPEMYLKTLSEDDGPKCDIWGIGILLYKIFWGQWIIEEDDQDVIEKLIQFKDEQYVYNYINQDKQKNLCFQDSENDIPLQKLIESIIYQCLQFDPQSRPSSMELLLEVHTFIKANSQLGLEKGIFNLYNPQILTQDLQAISTTQFQQLKKNQQNESKQHQNQEQNNDGRVVLNLRQQQQLINPFRYQKQIQKQKKMQNSNQNSKLPSKRNSVQMKNMKSQQNLKIDKQQEHILEQQDPQEIFILNGGGVLVTYQNNIIIYLSPFEEKWVLYNSKINMENLPNLHLGNILQGEGSLFLHGNRQIHGKFHEQGIPQECVMIDRFLKRKVPVMFDKLRIPTGASENMLYEDPVNKIGYLDDQKQFKKLIDIIKNNFYKENLFIDFQGNTVRADFDDQKGEIMVDLKSDPLMIMDKRKLLIAYKTKAYIIDYQTFTFITIADILHNEQPDKNITQLLQNLENTHSARYHMLEGLRYQGYLKDYQPNRGTLYWQFSNQVKIDGILPLYDKKLKKSEEFLKMEERSIHQSQISTNRNHYKYTQQSDQLQQIPDQKGQISKFQSNDNNTEDDATEQDFQDEDLVSQSNGLDENNLQLYQTKIIYQNQDFYEGTILNGLYHGKGVYGHKLKKIFDGEFEEDVFKQGKIYYHDGIQKKYEGDIGYNLEKKLYVRDGYGLLLFLNEDKYEGGFQNDLYHGQGTLTLFKKGTYEGNFVGGKKHGEGLWKDIKGNVYQGEYFNDKKQGMGHEKYMNGEEYEGEFKLNKRDGEGIYIYTQDNPIQSYQGTFQEGKKHDYGIELQRNGNKYKIRYYKDKELNRKFLGNQKSKQIQQQDFDQDEVYSFL